MTDTRITSRYAIYFSPESGSALARFGADWLGEDGGSDGNGTAPWSGLIDPAHRRAITSAPRGYGFHATLKPPFSLAEGVTLSDLEAAVEDFAAARPPVSLPALQLAVLGDFLAIVPRTPSPALNELAADAVCCLDAFRRPPSPEELAARRGVGLSERQDELLMDWGYPYVMEEFRFHMTLSNRLDETGQTRLLALLKPIVTPLLDAPLTIDAVSLFEQPAAGEIFSERARYRCSLV